MSNELVRVIRGSRKLSKATQRQYLRTIEEFVEFAGSLPVYWTPEAAQDFYQWLLTRPTELGPRGRTRGPLSVRSANAVYSRLHYASRRAAEMGYCIDFAKPVELARPEDGGSEPRALTREEVNRLLDACQGGYPIDLRDHAAATLLLKTGMRRFSATRIDLAHFFHDRRYACQRVEITLKGGHRHHVPLDSATVAALTPWKRWLSRRGYKDGPLFRSLRRSPLEGDPGVGERISGTGLYKALKRRAAIARVDEFYPHMLRHTFITWARQGGASDAEIAAVTGHVINPKTAVSTTIRSTYTDHDALAPQALEMLERIFT